MRKITNALTYITNIAIILTEFLIVGRFLLKFFAANENVAFTRWMYDFSYILVAPFLGVLPAPSFYSGHIIELSTVMAAILYGLVGYFIIYLLEIAGKFSDKEF